MKKELFWLISLNVNLCIIGILAVVWFERPLSIIIYYAFCLLSGFQLGLYWGLFQTKCITRKIMKEEFEKYERK